MQQNPPFVQAYPVVYESGSAPSAPLGADPTTSLFPPLNYPGAKEFLSKNHWPIGLQETFLKGLEKFPIRYIICDDSGSMCASDGKKLLYSGSKCTKVNCTRWNELTGALSFHAQLAQAANAPTQFRLLNGAPPVLIGDGNDPDEVNLRSFSEHLKNPPGGGTPLCRHVNEIVREIRAIEPQLRASGKKACIVIATDGESSDGNVADALRPLKDLPCWVVIRLCTDEDRITDYWNNIDSELELNMDVLDDQFGEAGEIHKVNPWLTYGEPLHRLREFGISIKELDLLDEAPLSLDQLTNFLPILLGGASNNYPHPEIDYKGFQTTLKAKLAEVEKVSNPIHLKIEDWILVNRLPKPKSASSGCVLC